MGGLPAAPRWAWVAMIAGVIAIAVMLPLAIGRGQVDPTATRSDASESATPTTQPAATSPTGTTAAGDPPVIAVYGDSYSSGSDQGGVGSAGWPALVADRLDAEVRLHAVLGAGYVATGGGTFREQVEASPEPDADVVVVFGSRNDTDAPPQQINAEAAGTYEAIRVASPSAELVVIGPAWSDEAVPEGTLAARNAVRSAAEAARVTFVDPLTEGWFFGRLELIGNDAIHPTDEGHAYLADLIEPVLREALARVADSG